MAQIGRSAGVGCHMVGVTPFLEVRKGTLPNARPHSACMRWRGGHEATDTRLAYAPVSQAHGHHQSVQCFALLHCSADHFSTTPGGF